MTLDGAVSLRDDGAVIQQPTIMNNRDEYQLFNRPLHAFPHYVRAHQLAGDLKLADDSAKPSSDPPSYMEYHARDKRPTVSAK